MWGGSQGRVSCGVMEKLGKLGVVSFNLPGFKGYLHWGLPQLYLPGLLTSLSLHPPLPLASKETPPAPRRRRKCCWLLPRAMLSCLVIWGPCQMHRV